MKEEDPSYDVPSTKVERCIDAWVVEVVLHQSDVGGYTLVVDVSLMLPRSP